LMMVETRYFHSKIQIKDGKIRMNLTKKIKTSKQKLTV